MTVIVVEKSVRHRYKTPRLLNNQIRRASICIERDNLQYLRPKSLSPPFGKAIASEGLHRVSEDVRKPLKRPQSSYSQITAEGLSGLSAEAEV